MRIVEKVLYGFGGLLALILLFIAFCHYNPELAVKIGADLKANAGEANVGSYDNTVQMVNTTVTLGQLPAAQNVRAAQNGGAPEQTNLVNTPQQTKETRAADDDDRLYPSQGDRNRDHTGQGGRDRKGTQQGRDWQQSQIRRGDLSVLRNDQ